MIIAVNDISFLWGFDTPYHAREALVRFGDAALGLRDERVSKVNDRIDIINSKNVNKGVLLAPDYPLIKALYEIREENMEQFLLILQILTQCGEEEDTGGDEFVIGEYSSAHCAVHRKNFLLSMASDERFEGDTVEGNLNGGEACVIRNISDETLKYVYWEELGFREYELNPKHGNRVYYRCGGSKVDIAPETDELGQKLLNRAVEIGHKLFAVDRENGNRIFEFRHSYANKFHGFRQEELTPDVRKTILQKVCVYETTGI